MTIENILSSFVKILNLVYFLRSHSLSDGHSSSNFNLFWSQRGFQPKKSSYIYSEHRTAINMKTSLPCQSFCAILDWECLWSLFQFSAQIANLPLLLPAFVFFEEVERDSSEMELRWIASSPLLSGFMQMDLSLGSPGGRRCLSFLLQIQRYPSYQSSQNNFGCPCAPFEVVSSCRVARVGGHHLRPAGVGLMPNRAPTRRP